MNPTLWEKLLTGELITGDVNCKMKNIFFKNWPTMTLILESFTTGCCCRCVVVVFFSICECVCVCVCSVSTMVVLKVDMSNNRFPKGYLASTRNGPSFGQLWTSIPF